MKRLFRIRKRNSQRKHFRSSGVSLSHNLQLFPLPAHVHTLTKSSKRSLSRKTWVFNKCDCISLNIPSPPMPEMDTHHAGTSAYRRNPPTIVGDATSMNHLTRRREKIKCIDLYLDNNWLDSLPPFL
ncbi:hypothetical protein FKM82_025111 [Ascaphus truei]